MADEKRATFPMLPAIHWWSLREKFRKKIPDTLTDSYLSKQLKTRPESAKVNILPYLRAIGFIDEQGNVQERAREWVDNARYGEICARIINDIYPEDLKDTILNPSENRAAVEAWFTERTKAGSSAAKRMTSFYTLLAEADLSSRKKRPAASGKAARKAGTTPVKTGEKVKRGRGPKKASPPAPVPSPELVPVNVNIQVHIPSDATTEQIQEIFRSMNKYFYRKLKS